MKLLDALNASNCGIAGRVTTHKTIARVRRLPSGKLRKIGSMSDMRWFESLLPSEMALETWYPVELAPGEALPEVRAGGRCRKGVAYAR